MHANYSFWTTLNIYLVRSSEKFYVHGSVHHKSILINVQRDATICSLYFISLQYHSTRFECRPHPSSGVHKTVVAATGTVHIICGATSLQRGQLGHGVRYLHD
jgi:hypothetical protein